jgi:hypothetical protein
MIVRLPTHHRRPRLCVATDGLWFRLPGRPAVPLRKRHALRRIVVALVELQRSNPGAALPMTQAFEAGWPGERAIPRAAATRVYTAVHELRQMGLDGMLVRRHGGYVLEADIFVTADPNLLESEIPAALPLEELENIPRHAEIEPIPESLAS